MNNDELMDFSHIKQHVNQPYHPTYCANPTCRVELTTNNASTYRRGPNKLDRLCRECNKKKHASYRGKDRERYTSYSRARRAQRLKTEATLTVAEWREILQKWNNSCAYCGAKEDIEQEHINPLGSGGTHTKENVVPACKHCNRKKAKRTPEEAGMSLRQV
jgi:5-methylcytosine-specific restriction endonuclease McrA